MTPGTGVPGRLGTMRLKPSGAGGCRFGSIIPSRMGGGREGGQQRGEEGQKCTAVTQSRGVHAGEPELGTKGFPATG